MQSDSNPAGATLQTPAETTKTSRTVRDEGNTTMQNHEAWFHLDTKIGHILENQRDDGERMSRLEVSLKDVKNDITAVRANQESCPGRIAEMKRQARTEAWKARGKLMMWVLGVVGAAMGVAEAYARLFGGS